MEKNLLSEADKEKFHVYIKKWQVNLGLIDWRFGFSKKMAGGMADMKSNLGARLATYRLGDWKGNPINDFELEKTACHEVLHTLLHEFAQSIRTDASAEVQESAEHRVVNTLEGLLVPQPVSKTNLRNPE